MRIRREQLDALERSLIARNNIRMARYARERFPQLFRDRPDHELIGFVDEVRQRARQHDITSEPDVATAVDLTAMYGPDFYAAQWAREVFAAAGWNGAQKLDIIRDRVRRRVPDF